MPKYPRRGKPDVKLLAGTISREGNSPSSLTFLWSLVMSFGVILLDSSVFDRNLSSFSERESSIFSLVS